MFFNCALVHPTVVARRAAFAQHRYEHSAESGAYAEDYDLWLRMVTSQRLRIANIAAPLLVRRIKVFFFFFFFEKEINL